MGYSLRFTLLRTTPAIIREIKVRGDMTGKDLRKLSAVLFKTDPQKSMNVQDEEGVYLLSESSLDLQMKKDSFWFLTFEDRPGWTVRMEVLGKTDDDPELPEVVRGRGSDTPAACRSIAEINQWMSWGGSRFSQSELQKIVSRSFRTIRPGEFQIDYEIAAPMSRTISRLKKSDMEQIGRILGLEIDSSLKKQQMAERMIADFKTQEVFTGILDQMPLSVYDRFRELCREGGNWRGSVYSDLEILYEFGLADEKGMSVLIAEEFLDLYEQWLSAGNEPNWLRRRALRDIILFGIRVYGILPKNIAVMLLKTYYPKYFDEKLFDDDWKWAAEQAMRNSVAHISRILKLNGADRRSVRGSSITADLVYDLRCLEETSALEVFRRNSVFPTGWWYVPENAEFQKILSEDLHFSEKLYYDFLQILKMDYYLNDRQVMRMYRDAYYCIHIGWTDAQVIKMLTDEIFSNRKALIKKKLEQFFRNVRGYVRCIDCLGHTPGEWIVIGGDRYV